jgi:N-acetylglucosaminyldiphosphoundecaprenol N-acetyl-beta-D-mannosaminyltransferase
MSFASRLQTGRPFGLKLSTASAVQIAQAAIDLPRAPEAGVGLVVTPNIEHVAKLRRSAEFQQAYRDAAVIVCDGWPVRLYARIRGMPVQRVTGCEIAAALMRGNPYPEWHRLFFVVDGAETELALHRWAAAKGISDRVASFIPPFGFEADDRLCHGLAQRIRDHRTTLLLMAVGAPRSEIFINRYRHEMPPCWAFCVGQAVKIELGLVTRAPGRWQAAGLEWLWRVKQEPQRLARRYIAASFGFTLAVIEDVASARRGSLP